MARWDKARMVHGVYESTTYTIGWLTPIIAHGEHGPTYQKFPVVLHGLRDSARDRGNVRTLTIPFRLKPIKKNCLCNKKSYLKSSAIVPTMSVNASSHRLSTQLKTQGTHRARGEPRHLKSDVTTFCATKNSYRIVNTVHVSPPGNIA